jgi:hypothetical protein
VQAASLLCLEESSLKLQTSRLCPAGSGILARTVALDVTNWTGIQVFERMDASGIWVRDTSVVNNSSLNEYGSVGQAFLAASGDALLTRESNALLYDVRGFQGAFKRGSQCLTVGERPTWRGQVAHDSPRQPSLHSSISERNQLHHQQPRSVGGRG